MIYRIYGATRLFLHIMAGITLLVLTGALWNNKTALVKTTKCWWLGRATRLLGIRIQTHGEIPRSEPDRGVLYVSNHISWIDIPLIGSLTKLNFLSKAEVRDWPLIGKLAEGTGTLFIRRGSGDADRIAKSIAEYLDEGRNVLFFPEGTTSDGRSVRRFHSKLFKAVHHTDISLCPVAIHYSINNSDHNPVAFIDDHEFSAHLWNLLKYRDITAHVAFLPTRIVPNENVEAFVRAVRQEISHSVQRLNKTTQLNTSTQWPDASIHDDQKGEATSF